MSTQASTSTTSEEKSTPTQSAVVRKYNTNELIGFLREQEDLKLNDSHFEILANEEITGRDFLQMTKQEFKEAGLKMGPASRLADFAKKIEDNDEDLQYCMTDKKRKMGNLGSETGSNEALCCEYISTILHASLIIAKRITKKKITLKPEFEVTGDEATGRVDYAIKKVFETLDEELICITEGN
ncbi:12067_t:CDS:2 [Entrophospora sp. SA101]|nr:5968_t:CDS:2 [Entrophospora sp. SA101]CAJ0845446.1 10708_t:CDS:2 [Entrophospora sp. SA101]CAJ0906557.1 12067_t:CDS:2 [Entrophospora sp. SA101]